MTGTDGPDDDRTLAGEYVLGLLAPDDARSFEARLAAEPDLAREVAQWQAHFAALADEVEDVAPPDRVWTATQARVFGARPRRSVWRWLVPLGAVAVLVVGLVLSSDLVTRGPVPPANPAYHADLVSDSGAITVVAGYDADAGTLYVERRGPDPDAGRDFELWLIAGDDAPVSLGVLPEARAVDIPLAPDLQAVLDGATLAVSDEPDGGSPTGQPTGAVLAAGALTPV